MADNFFHWYQRKNQNYLRLSLLFSLSLIIIQLVNSNLLREICINNTEELFIVLNIVFISIAFMKTIANNRKGFLCDASEDQKCKLEKVLGVSNSENFESKVKSDEFPDETLKRINKEVAKERINKKKISLLFDELKVFIDSKVRPVERLMIRAQSSINQFNLYWVFVWFSWLIYYMWKIICLKMSCAGGMTSIIESALNTVNTFTFILCYTVLSYTTIHMTKEDKEDINNRTKKIRIAFLLIIVLIKIAELFLDFLGHYNEFSFYFNIIHGVIATIGLVLFTSSFDNRLFNVNFGIILILYIYASTQGLFPLMVDNMTVGNMNKTAIKPLYYGFAFFSKILMFSFVSWLSETRKLYFFFLRSNMTYRESRERWNRFTKEVKCDIDSIE